MKPSSPDDHVRTLREVNDELAARNGALRLRIQALEEMLGQCADVLGNYSDVVDGDYGVPAPNAAMQMLSEIERELK